MSKSAKEAKILAIYQNIINDLDPIVFSNDLKTFLAGSFRAKGCEAGPSRPQAQVWYIYAVFINTFDPFMHSGWHFLYSFTPKYNALYSEQRVDLHSCIFKRNSSFERFHNHTQYAPVSLRLECTVCIFNFTHSLSFERFQNLLHWV